LRARAREAAGRARGAKAVADRLRRARREDPHVQLPREPGDRPPDQAHRAQTRPDRRRRPGRLHRGVAGRGAAARARVIVERAAAVLAGGGVATPRTDAEWIVAHVAGVTRSELASLDDDFDERAVQPLVERRAAREPLAYVLGEWGFRRLTLRCDRRALVPRPETEVVVERCLELLRDASAEAPWVLDVGTGTGAIALALADELPGARVVGVDSSPDALALASENAAATGLGVELGAGD